MPVDELFDPAQYVAESHVPLLDEHILKGKGGADVTVDRSFLEEIAQNNNRKFSTTGDPAALIVGHTPDDESQDQKPVVGWAVNFRVEPFRNGEGRQTSALYADLYFRKDKEHVIKDFPRRSVELWVAKKEIDPIALLGGTTPERDLGVIRFSRPPATVVKSSNDLLVQYYSRKTESVYRYSLESPVPDEPFNKDMQKDVKEVDAAEAPGESKAFKSLESMMKDLSKQIAEFVAENAQLKAQVEKNTRFVESITQLLQDETGGELGGDMVGVPPMGGDVPPGPGGLMDEAPPADADQDDLLSPPGDDEMGGEPDGDEAEPLPTEEARVEQEGNPVKFADGGYGCPGPTNTSVPSNKSGSKKMSREVVATGEVAKLQREVANLKKARQDDAAFMAELKTKNTEAQVSKAISKLAETGFKVKNGREKEAADIMTYIHKNGGDEALAEYVAKVDLWEKAELRSPADVRGPVFAQYAREDDGKGTTNIASEQDAIEVTNLRLKFQREEGLSPKDALAKACQTLGKQRVAR